MTANPIIERLGPLVPPLRLIVTTACWGHCPFCHAEGARSDTMEEMTVALARSAAKAAREIGLPRVSISGGEPTLVKHLARILEETRRAHPSCAIGITTNGFALAERWLELTEYIDTIDVSIHSLDARIWRRLTRVAPLDLLDCLDERMNKLSPRININCVITEENCETVQDLINICRERRHSLTLMVQVPTTTIVPSVRDTICRIIRENGLDTLRLGSTPYLCGHNSIDVSLRLKLPALSALIRWEKCSGCHLASACGEYFCALRVFPNGAVSGCRMNAQRASAGSSDEVIVAVLLRELRQMTGEIQNWTDLMSFPIGTRTSQADMQQDGSLL